MTGGPVARTLVSLLTYLRGLASRAPVASLVALAVAGAAVLLSRRRPRAVRASRGGAGGSAGGAPRPRALAGVRRVTIGADFVPGNDDLGPLFEKDAEGALVVRTAAAPYLKRFAKMCDLYVISRIADDEGEATIRSALEAAGVFAAGMDPRKVLFCETADGRVSVVRQLEPHLHIDRRADIITSLQRFIKFVALVTPGAESIPGPTGTNVFKYETLDSFWTNPQR